jgi:hypothetical protein
MSEPSYHFGVRLAGELDYFAFPRTGSHFLWYCFTGLFDLVFFPTPYTNQPEPRQRREELDPMALQALELRTDGAGYHPLHIRHDANGLHGAPVDGGRAMILLVRDPRAVLYSYYHTAVERWGAQIPDPVAWLHEQSAAYRRFYDVAWQLRDAAPERVLLLRYEELRRDAEALRRVVAFVGVPPKLPPEFVFWCCQFERFTRPGPRTFFRQGDDQAWRRDAVWRERLETLGDFSRYGY